MSQQTFGIVIAIVVLVADVGLLLVAVRRKNRAMFPNIAISAVAAVWLLTRSI